MTQIVPETRETLESAGWQFTDKESIYARCAAISKDEAGNYVWDLNEFLRALSGSANIYLPQSRTFSRAEIIEKGLFTQEFFDNFGVLISGLIVCVSISGTSGNQVVGTGVTHVIGQIAGTPLWRYVCGTAETVSRVLNVHIQIEYNYTTGLTVSTVRIVKESVYDDCLGVRYFGSRPVLVLPDSVTLTGHSDLTLTYTDQQFRKEFHVTDAFIEAFATDPDLCLASIKPFTYSGYEGENKHVFVATELEDTLIPQDVLFRKQTMRFVLLTRPFDSDTDSWFNAYDRIELTRNAPVVDGSSRAEWTLQVLP